MPLPKTHPLSNLPLEVVFKAKGFKTEGPSTKSLVPKKQREIAAKEK